MLNYKVTYTLVFSKLYVVMVDVSDVEPIEKFINSRLIVKGNIGLVTFIHHIFPELPLLIY